MKTHKPFLTIQPKYNWRIFLAAFFSIILFSCGGADEANPEESNEDIKPPVLVEELTITANNIQFYVKKVGKGIPVIVIHGGPAFMHNYFLPHLEPLAQDYQFILFDQRGCGKSSFPADSSFKMEDYVADIDALIAELKPDKTILFGHSWGGLIAANYADAHKEKVHQLILCNSFPINSTFYEQSLERKNAKRSEQDTKEWVEVVMSSEYKNGQPETMKKAFLLNEKYNLARPDTYEEVFAQVVFPGTSQKLQKLTEGLSERYLYNYNIQPMLQQLTCPVLIIQSDLDNIPFEATQALHESIKHAELVVIKNSCHYPFAENPEDFGKALQRFIK